jgi:N-alpha-acetyltransferase 15/16, NatA auxiliary subunit
MRDLEGFVETRYQLLQIKPANKNNWLGFAIAHHINSNYDVAAQILDAYEGVTGAMKV